MARKTIIAGNWKMNLLPDQGEELVLDLSMNYRVKPNLEVVVLPPMPFLAFCYDWTRGTGIKFGAQNCHDQLAGAFTGESSPEMLKILGCEYCLAGHSERREIFGETNEFVGRKAQTLISMGVSPIVCVGESLEEREAGVHFGKIGEQVRSLYSLVDEEGWSQLVIAYEPIWAIGTGKTATPADANEVHQFIRAEIKMITGDLIAEATSILYGGSAKPSNAADLLSQPEIDGLLVGGASLTAEDFLKIIQAY